MPNHVYHTISIGNEITKERQEILNNIEKAGGICRYYKPMPKELEGTSAPADKPNWYDWCCENWGTKWGCYDFEKDGDQLRFTTAWSPMDDTIIKLMAQDFPNMLWNYEEEQGWGAEISIEEGEFVDIINYDTPTWNGEEEIDCGGKHPVTLTKLAEEHRNFDDGIGWYVEWSHEFAGKTLKEAKEYLLNDVMGSLDENGDLI